MALTLAQQLEALNAAIASGALLTRIGEHEVRYRNLDEMLRARQDVEQRIAAASAATAPSVTYAAYERD